ncbi:uncharacterized protein [Macaca fascicularis]|uniref:uncharacterized protein n=1 Tax=Macaca fascicularis TaxID=9541 RepID=UPI0032B02F54
MGWERHSLSGKFSSDASPMLRVTGSHVPYPPSAARGKRPRGSGREEERKQRADFPSPIWEMGSGQLLTSRSLAQLPAEPSAGREAEHLDDISARAAPEQRLGRERCARAHVGPRGRRFLGARVLFFSLSTAAPSPAPQPQAPSLPGSRRAELLHWRPRLARGHPRSSGKRHHFSLPLEHLQASARLPTPILSMKNRARIAAERTLTLRPDSQAGSPLREAGTAAPTGSRALCGPCPGSGLARGRPRDRGTRRESRRRPRTARTDSWREGAGAGGNGGRGLIGVTFQKNSQRVAGVIPRGEKKFSYHVEREDSQRIFQMGSAFPVPV